MVPEALVLDVAKAEFEGDAAEYQCQQHEQHGEVQRRDDDRESQREGGEQGEAAKHQPGLVAVPDRRDGIHDQVARLEVRLEAIEDADAEIEAVEQDVEEDAGGDDRRPDRNEADDGVHHASPLGCSSTVIGLLGLPPSISSSRCASATAGPLLTMRAMIHAPAGKMIR